MRQMMRALVIVGFVATLTLAGVAPAQATAPLLPTSAGQERLVVFEVFTRST